MKDEKLRKNLRHTIDISPMSKYQWAIVLMATIMNFLDGFDVLAIAFTASAISQDFALTKTEFGVLVSVGLMGMTMGSLVLTPLADKIGCRLMLLIAVTFSAIGMAISAISQSYEMLGFSRVITGLGVGGILVGTNVMTSEYSSAKWRSLAISICSAGFGIDAMSGGILAATLQIEYGWQSIYAIGAILAVLSGLMLFFYLPESIGYLTAKQPANALHRLNQITNKLGLVGVWQLTDKNNNPPAKLPISLLFSKQYLRATLVLWSAFFAIMFSFYFINSWTPALLKEAGMSMQASVNIGLMISLGGAFGSLLYGLIASRWAAKSVLMLFSVLSAIAIILFTYYANHLSIAMIIGIIVGVFVNGCVSGLYAITPMTYAANIRSTGVGCAISAGRIGSILAPTIAGILLDGGLAKQDLYLCVAAIMLVATFILVFKKPHIDAVA
ncbi:MFS transporter [[Haemophilus] ducreyi]|uniref:Transport protein n=2 Tax=Haemophilus ducreyi TaxID=730 RepID=Q7VMX3_HAEDU|nr:putative transport protein [[Haemophilus] ducreyi 35000HP]AKO31592.1 MFS transporter [[Haemophilus] ducreyi]AKO33049.1 MFS transporter [[Haemophilus] ducreyi]AKO34497.1 MFS transporter [[Haemophilus] ducreyi]AKO35934.1 MFS transporter [[Haemophilus] ducreyi]